MKLVHATLRPARVIEVLGRGKIRVEAPGKFSAADKDSLPPVYPFFGQHANSYTTVNEGDEVWLLSCSDNPRQLHWIRKDNFEENDQEMMGGKNVEILMNQKSGIGWATLLFEDGTGWLLRNGEGIINIDKDGNILLSINEPNRAISISSEGISLGTKGVSNHKAAFGDETQKALEVIYALFNALKMAAGESKFTAHLVPAITSQLSGLDIQIPKITSENVTLD